MPSGCPIGSSIFQPLFSVAYFRYVTASTSLPVGKMVSRGPCRALAVARDQSSHALSWRWRATSTVAYRTCALLTRAFLMLRTAHGAMSLTGGSVSFTHPSHRICSALCKAVKYSLIIITHTHITQTYYFYLTAQIQTETYGEIFCLLFCSSAYFYMFVYAPVLNVCIWWFIS